MPIPVLQRLGQQIDRRWGGSIYRSEAYTAKTSIARTMNTWAKHSNREKTQIKIQETNMFEN